jgi:hypothetical protein
VADEFRTIQKLPPLRLTVADVAQLGDELTGKVRSGGRVDIEYAVYFSDDSRFSRDSTAAFLENLDPEGERISALEVSVRGWQAANGEVGSERIARHVALRFHSYGSDFSVASDDVLWGKGAVEDLKRRLRRHRPWFAPLIGALPAVSGAVFPFVFFAMLAAIISTARDGISALSLVVIVLSAVLLAGDAWLFSGHVRDRVLTHTVVSRTASTWDWQKLTIAIALVALVGDLAAVIALFVK